MQKKQIKLAPKWLVGITARTNNKAEMNLATSKIGATMGQYFGQQLAQKIKHRVNPGVTYAVYTEYESDEHGEYTYFLGEEVASLDGQDLTTFKTITIAAGDYQKLTTPAGTIPKVVIDAWQAIWQMTEKDFGGKRAYRADFEVYDQRAMDPNNAVVDVYIGHF